MWGVRDQKSGVRGRNSEHCFMIAVGGSPGFLAPENPGLPPSAIIMTPVPWLPRRSRTMLHSSVIADAQSDAYRPTSGSSLSLKASRWLMLIATAIGVICRVAQYAADQS